MSHTKKNGLTFCYTGRCLAGIAPLEDLKIKPKIKQLEPQQQQQQQQQEEQEQEQEQEQELQPTTVPRKITIFKIHVPNSKKTELHMNALAPTIVLPSPRNIFCRSPSVCIN